MALEEFLVDVERQEAVGVVAGNGECRLGEVVGTEGSEAIDRVNVIVIACNFGAQGGDDFAAGDGGHSNRPATEHRVLFLFQAAVVRKELVQRGVEQTDRLADAFLNTFANALLKSRGAVPFSPPCLYNASILLPFQPTVFPVRMLSVNPRETVHRDILLVSAQPLQVCHSENSH